jgi:hypothetical protein
VKPKPRFTSIKVESVFPAGPRKENHHDSHETSTTKNMNELLKSRIAFKDLNQPDIGPSYLKAMKAL